MWNNFAYFLYLSLVLWIMALCLFSFCRQVFWGMIGYFLGSLVLLCFMVLLWQSLERPPIRTLAETRLWYSFFLSLIAGISYLLYKQGWMLWLGFLGSSLFLFITALNPDTVNKTLMPALQSYWFIPHVIVYLFAYSILGMATLQSGYGLYLNYRQKPDALVYKSVNVLVYVGYTFLTLGLVFGALWAKDAWGHYWTWDPKETWAFITWLAYLVYIHYNFKSKTRQSPTIFYLVIIAFFLLIICWFGVNYLPTAKNSVHTYSNS